MNYKLIKFISFNCLRALKKKPRGKLPRGFFFVATLWVSSQSLWFAAGQCRCPAAGLTYTTRRGYRKRLC